MATLNVSDITSKFTVYFHTRLHIHIAMKLRNAKHSGMAMSKHNNKRSDAPVNDREQVYCIALQCQINCFCFHSYTSW
jgi:hypothetical protein